MVTCAERGRVTLVGLPSGRIPVFRHGAVVTCAVRGRVTLVGLSAGGSPWPIVSVTERFE